MKKYTPKDALPLPQPLAGKGFFSRLLIPDDGDKRKAEIYGVALEAAANALEWIRHRLVNGLEGGSYDGPLSFTNVQTLGSHDPPIHVTSAVDIHGEVTVTGSLVVDGDTVASGDVFALGNVTSYGNVSGMKGNFQNITAAENITAGEKVTTRQLHFSGIVGATMTGFVTDSTFKTRSGLCIVTGGTKRSGAGAWVGTRGTAAGPDIPKVGAVVTIQTEQFDVLIAPAVLTAPGAYKLAAPSDPAAKIEITIIRTGSSCVRMLTILDADGVTPIVRLPNSTNLHRSMVIAWDGAHYYLKYGCRTTIVSGVPEF